MNTSTAGVTLLTGFVFDVLAEYQGVRKMCGPAFELAAGLNISRHDDWCSIDIYNGVCAWVEDNVGSTSVRRAGVAIGERAFETMVARKVPTSDPLAMMKALQLLATQVIRDPYKRGWEVTQQQPRHIQMRRTQTFNCILQEGMLLALLERTRVLMPSVRHVRCTRQGDEFCDYEIRWLRDARA
jgi:hypothetical protein